MDLLPQVLVLAAVLMMVSAAPTTPTTPTGAHATWPLALPAWNLPYAGWPAAHA
jgi:hypothetical protein